MVNQKYLDKAEVLIEALPYIQRFNRKIVVVKYGGSAMLDDELKKNVIKEISRWVGKVGMEPKFINGLRVTDKDTMEIAEMVLAKVNKELVAMVESLGVNAVGISGKDGGLLKCRKKQTEGGDIGFVGEVTKVEPKILEDLLEKDFLPIIFPVGYDDEFATYNINADDAACAIAEAVHAEKLAFLSDIEGVYKDKDDPSSLISELHVDEAQKLIDDGYVGGGMIPKLKNCIDAIEEGVNRVHILDGRIPHSLLLEIFTNKGIGTAILREDGEKYYNEQGCYLYDSEGKEYLDFAAGIAVNSLGYHYPGYDEALKDQIDKLMHISNLYYNEPIIEAGAKLVKASKMSKAFFTNSGTEAIEGALKAAKKYAYVRDGHADHEIIAMNHSFHGRSIGALSVTGTAHYREPFEPLMGGVKFADFNNLESVKAQITDKTCAIITEVVQGEGGIYPAKKEFLEGLRQICDEKDIMLIFDEIQCGMGRTGHYFAWQAYGVQPDIMTSAKALGCGVPVGAFVLGEKAAKASLEPGDHGTTYGGNPFVCAAVSKVFDIYENDKIIEHVQEMTPYLEQKLDEIVAKHECAATRRGMGFMQGIVIQGRPVGEVVKAALAKGLLVISAGSDVLRIVPPLVITKEHIDKMAAILDECME